MQANHQRRDLCKCSTSRRLLPALSNHALHILTCMRALFHTHFLQRVSPRIYTFVFCRQRGQMQFRKVVLRVCLDRNSDDFYAKHRKIPSFASMCTRALEDLLKQNVKPFTSQCAQNAAGNVLLLTYMQIVHHMRL